MMNAMNDCCKMAAPMAVGPERPASMYAIAQNLLFDSCEISEMVAVLERLLFDGDSNPSRAPEVPGVMLTLCTTRDINSCVKEALRSLINRIEG